MTIVEGFKDLFLRIGFDLFSPEGFIALGILIIFIMIVYLVKKNKL